MRNILATGLFLIAAILSSPGYATSGPVTVVVTDASCMYFELRGLTTH